jgi:hypothetical protein
MSDTMQEMHDALVIAEGQRDQLRAERDALRAVYHAAAVYCGHRTIANEHALIDAVGEIQALAVQPLPLAEETL